jgi:hypothetical protein
MRARVFWIAALLACEPTGFEPEYVVDTLRVLAVQADASIAAPGQTVHFTTLSADPNGAGRAIQWAWGTCVNPGSSQVPDCADDLSSLAMGSDSFSATVPTNALDGIALGELGVIFAACAGTIALAPNAQNGAPVTCTDGNGALVGRDGFVWGGTRVSVLNGFVNANPQIDQIFFDGQPWSAASAPSIATCVEKDMSDCPADTTHVFSYTATPGSAETYDPGTGTPITEQLIGWFYVSQGSLTAGYASPDADDAGATIPPPTFEMQFAPTLSDRSHQIQVWLVLRDDRGGLSFGERSLSWQ